jgi:hypothetical protein
MVSHVRWRRCSSRLNMTRGSICPEYRRRNGLLAAISVQTKNKANRVSVWAGDFIDG